MKTHVVNKESVNKDSLKKTFIASLSALTLFASASVVQAKEQDFSRAQKELRIMTKIFETTLEDASANSNKIRLAGSRNVDSTYLAKQGMVFTFNFSRNAFPQSEWGAFGEGVGQMVNAIAAEVGHALAEVPLPPEAPVVVSPAPNVSIDYEEYWDAYQERMEALEALRERHREQREQVRELQREIRSLERQSSREEREQKELKKVKGKLEEKMQVLNQKMNEYKESMAEYRKKRDQKYTQSTQLKSDAIISTLCDYGTTMRSLKSGEHVTIIFNNFNDNKDQVYVFNAIDVKRCEDSGRLLDRAISYQL